MEGVPKAGWCETDHGGGKTRDSVEPQLAGSRRVASVPPSSSTPISHKVGLKGGDQHQRFSYFAVLCYSAGISLTITDSSRLK